MPRNGLTGSFVQITDECRTWQVISFREVAGNVGVRRRFSKGRRAGPFAGSSTLHRACTGPRWGRRRCRGLRWGLGLESRRRQWRHTRWRKIRSNRGQGLSCRPTMIWRETSLGGGCARDWCPFGGWAASTGRAGEQPSLCCYHQLLQEMRLTLQLKANKCYFLIRMKLKSNIT